MVIAVCTIELSIPTATSLKDKRRVVKSITARLRNEYNVSVAEVDRLDAHTYAIIAVVTVSGDRKYADGLMSRVINWIEHTRLDCDVVDYQVELF